MSMLFCYVYAILDESKLIESPFGNSPELSTVKKFIKEVFIVEILIFISIR